MNHDRMLAADRFLLVAIVEWSLFLEASHGQWTTAVALVNPVDPHSK